MAFTVTAMEQFRKYRNGAQTDSIEYTLSRNPDYDVIRSSYTDNVSVVNPGTFSGAAYYSGNYPNNDVFGRDLTETTHGCFCFNARKVDTPYSDYSSQVIKLMSGSVQVAAIGAGGVQTPQDPTLFYKAGTKVLDLAANAGGMPVEQIVLVEIYWYIHATSGVLKLFIGGNEVYSFTGNTDFNGGAGVDRLIITCDYRAFVFYEYYFGSVTARSDMPRRRFSINQLPVNSDELTTDWTANGAGAHYEDIDDETVADGGATTITATSNTAKCLFGIDDQYIPADYTPFAVQLSVVGQRDLAAPDICDVRVVALSSATEVQGTWEQLQTTSWEFTSPFVIASDPNGGGAWSSNALANLQVGVEVGVQA